MLKLESRAEGLKNEETCIVTKRTAANINKWSNWFLLLEYGQFANQLGAYRHLLYWTVYACMHAHAENDIIKCKSTKRRKQICHLFTVAAVTSVSAPRVKHIRAQWSPPTSTGPSGRPSNFTTLLRAAIFWFKHEGQSNVTAALVLVWLLPHLIHTVAKYRCALSVNRVLAQAELDSICCRMTFNNEPICSYS